LKGLIHEMLMCEAQRVSAEVAAGYSSVTNGPRIANSLTAIANCDSNPSPIVVQPCIFKKTYRRELIVEAI